jgi:virulence-associated protein VapD
MRIALPGRPEKQPPDTVTRRIHQLIDQPVYRSIMERHGLTRVPGSVYLDENGEVA